jgi:hypothetical protein
MFSQEQSKEILDPGKIWDPENWDEGMQMDGLE